MLKEDLLPKSKERGPYEEHLRAALVQTSADDIKNFVDQFAIEVVKRKLREIRRVVQQEGKNLASACGNSNTVSCIISVRKKKYGTIKRLSR